MFSYPRPQPATRQKSNFLRLCLFFLLAIWPLFAGEAIFFPLVREGSASAILDADTHTAYLVDGGQKGSLVERPLLAGMPVLSYLRSKNFDTVFIVCSHPHADHQAGLLELVKYRGPDDLSNFKRVIFVDSDYPAKSSLRAAYEETHGRRPEYESATDRNAFAELRKQKLAPEDGSVIMNNFAYKPVEGKGPHGYSVVSEYSLVNGAERTHVVDFDDADSVVVAKWAEAHSRPAGKEPTVYVAPHHNSDRTNIDPLLSGNQKPDAVIFPVNADNRFLHPGPANWKKWIDSVGLENVHITGLGKEIKVGSKGVPPLTSAELDRVPKEIIEPMLWRLDLEKARILELSLTPLIIQNGNDLKNIRERKSIDISRAELSTLAGVSIGQLQAWESNSQPFPDADRQKLAALLRKQEVKTRWKALQQDRLNLEAVNKAYNGDSNYALLKTLAIIPLEFDEPRSGGADIPPRGPDSGPTASGSSDPLRPGPTGRGPASGETQSSPDSPPSDGTLNFKTLQRANAFSFLSAIHPSDGTMNFKTLQQELRINEVETPKAVAPTAVAGGASSESGGGGGGFGPIPRVQRFELSTSGMPVFGGVVIGNRVRLEDGWKLISARIEQSSVEDEEPSTEILLRIEKNGVVVERSYSNFTNAELWSAYHVVRPLDSWKKQYDVRDQDSGMIGIAGHTSDGSYDKQVDTGWTFGINPALANTALAEDGMQLDMTVARLASGIPSAASPISLASVALLKQAPYWSTYQWFDSPSIVKVSGSKVEVVAETEPTNILLRLRYIPDGAIVYPLYHRFFTSSQRETQTSNQLVQHLIQELDYIRRIDRFAKTVAVLNLIADTSRVPFPELPPGVVQPLVRVNAALTYSAEDRILGLGDDRTSHRISRFWLDVALVLAILLGMLIVFLLATRYFYRRWRAKRRKLALAV